MVTLGVVFAMAGCTTHGPQAPEQTTQSAPSVPPAATLTALPAVPVVRAAELPPWFVAVSPKGEAADGAQIRIRFTNDLVPVEALESPDRAEVLSHFSIEPPLPGRFILLTPRMIGFQADALIPHGSRIDVRVSAGLKDLAAHKLVNDYVWGFTTKAVTLALDVPTADNGTPAPVGLTPAIGIDASDAVDTKSLIAHTHLVDTSNGSREIALQIAPSPSPDPAATAGPARDTSGAATGDTAIHYTLIPVANLATATTYDVTIDRGVVPLAGNLATAESARAQLHTYGTLTLTGASMSGEPGKRFADGEPVVTFSNTIDAASALKNITLRPRPASSLPLLRADQNGIVTIDSDALAPRTTYRVNVASGITDIFGQTLAQNGTTTFSTGDLAPVLWAPTGSSIFPADANLALDVATTNLPGGGYRAAFHALEPRDLILNDTSYIDDSSTLLPPRRSWPHRAFGQPLNEAVEAALPLHALLGARTGMLAYGITAKTVPSAKDSEQPVFTGSVALTNIGVFAQWFPGSGIVRAHHLGDGSPIQNASVAIFEIPSGVYGQTSAASADEAPCAAGKTDASGTWHVSAASFGPCASVATRDGSAPALMALVRENADWAYVKTRPYSDGYAYGLSNQGWSAGAPQARGAIVSDRALYQPGESAKFLGVSYFERNDRLGRGLSPSFEVTATSPSGTKKKLGAFAPDAFGTFTVPLRVAMGAEVGYWAIEARGSSGEVLDGSYRVAEFKPPNFKVDLTLDSDVVTMGTSVSSHSTSTYLFGAPVQSGTSHVAVTRAAYTFAPKGYEQYSFGREWLYPEEMPEVSSDVVQSDVALDASGNASLPIPVATDLPYPMQYTAAASTTDVSNLSVSDTKTFVALPGDAAIGLRTDFLAVAGKQFDVSAIVLDPHGKPLSGRAVRVVVQKRTYESATQLQEGSETAHDSVKYDDVTAQDVTPNGGESTVHVTLNDPGEYRIRATFAGATSDATATDAEIWVAGAGEAAWFGDDGKQLTVKLDKATYRPGSAATALIESPFADADLYFSVVRHGVLYERHQVVHGSAPEVRFTITQAMLPNASVEALLVRRGAPLKSGVAPSLTHLSRLGFAPFEVALDGKYLKVAIAPSHATLAPAGTQTLTFHVSGRDGKPARSEVALAVVNDAILQLDGYRFPDIAAGVYADLPISTRFGDNRDDVKLQSEHRTFDKGFGFGGGAMEGPGSTRVRTKFVPLAYWNAKIRTDASGSATVSFKLPDDLTTWRVMALGLTSDARFGNGEATFVTTKPLVTNPVLPQFARPGDTFSAGVAVTNVAKKTGTLAIAAAALGGATFADGDPHAARTSAPADAATAAYRFAATISNQHAAKFKFTSSVGTSTDAFAFTIPVIANDVMETVVTTGTTNAAVSIPIDLAPTILGTVGSLRVTMASTLLGDVAEPIDALQTPSFPLATDLASRIAVASDATLLDRRYGRLGALPTLKKSALADLVSLRALALPDGGFGDWPGAAKSNVFTAAYEATQLNQAKLAGFQVDADLAHVASFLGKAIANPKAVADCDDAKPSCAASVRLAALAALASIGEPRNQFVSDILAQQTALSYYDRVALSRFLYRLDDWHGMAAKIRDDVLQQVNLSARHAVVDVRGSFGESEAAGQAQLLGLAVESGMPAEDVDRLLATLLDQRRGGRWGCTCEDAEAMNALVTYAQRDLAPPDFIGTATLPATPPKIVQSTFRGFGTTLSASALPVNEVTRGPANVTLTKRGTGTLHYTVTLDYRAPDRMAGIYAGIRIDRILRAVGSGGPVASFGLAVPAATASVAAARVYDIEDRIVVDHPVENVLVTDPLPAGFEAVDQSFRTSAPADLDGSDGLSVDYQSIYKDRVVTFVSRLDAGSYAVHYIVRSVTPGLFAWPGATAELQYAPEEFGRTASTLLQVTQP